MITIWKFKIESDITTIEMPIGAQILTVQSQYGEPVMWALVDASRHLCKRSFEIFGTGQSLPELNGLHREYVGTFQVEGGSLVFHLFEIKSNQNVR